MSGGKGGSTTTSGSNYSSGTSSTQIPSWVESASQSALASGQALAAQPYTPYTWAQQVAGTPGDTLQAEQQTRNQQGMVDPAYNAASSQWGGVLGNLQSLTPDQQNQLTNQLYGNYAGNVVAPSAGLFGQYLGQGPATAGQVGSNAMSLMQPYEQAVLNPAITLGQQQLAQNLQQIGAGANQANAFGGTRQGVMEGVAQSQAATGLAQYAGNMLAQGYNAALTPSTQLALQQGQQGYGAAGAMAGLLSGGYGTAAGQAQQMAGTNLGLGTQAAQQIPGLATAQQTADQSATAALQASGAAQQQQAQNYYNTLYGNWAQQQAWPYMQQQELLSTLEGIPYGTTTTSQGWNVGNQTATNNPSIGSMVNQGVGLLGSALSLFNNK